jgi:ATP-dependent Lon protease
MMPALVDRMEIIELPGYTSREKLEIAKRHLIPNALRYHAIRETVEFPDDAIVAIINNWTREAGVRTLDRQIAKICRKIITDVWGEDTFQLTTRALAGYLGPKTVHGEAGTLAHPPGVAMGLAYTEAGGTIMFVEAEQYAARTRFVRIEDQISVTGRVASVMQESILLALKRVRRLAEDRNNVFGISKASFEKTRFDLNVSPLAVEKDGPSGAVAVFVTLVSVLSGVCVDADVAMTGELNQRGMVLPVGGLAQKFGAAHRQGIKRVLFPWQLEEEVEHLQQDYPDLKELTFIPIRNDREVLEYAFSEYFASTDP